MVSREWRKTLAIVLAGGKGTRLAPLVEERCKPAVPFAGKFRIIDFVLSNCLNSDIRQIQLLVQYKSHSLQKHIRDAWGVFSNYLGEYTDIYPPQQREGDRFYMGTADAVYQNRFAIFDENPDRVLILSGDHIYRMDYREMIEFHEQNGAGLTIAAMPVPIEDGKAFGVMSVDDNSRIVAFNEKPPNPTPMPGRPDVCLASMGIYVFDRDLLVESITEDAVRDTEHDFGKNIIPSLINSAEVYAYLFQDDSGQPAYWRDVGTIKSYYQANMDSLPKNQGVSLSDRDWPIRTLERQCAPMRMGTDTTAKVTNSHVSPGCQIDGVVENSLVGFGVRIGPGAVVRNSVISDDSVISAGAHVENAILDKHAVIGEGIRIDSGVSLDENIAFKQEGITVIKKHRAVLHQR